MSKCKVCGVETGPGHHLFCGKKGCYDLARFRAANRPGTKVKLLCLDYCQFCFGPNHYVKNAPRRFCSSLCANRFRGQLTQDRVRQVRAKKRKERQSFDDQWAVIRRIRELRRSGGSVIED